MTALAYIEIRGWIAWTLVGIYLFCVLTLFIMACVKLLRNPRR